MGLDVTASYKRTPRIIVFSHFANSRTKKNLSRAVTRHNVTRGTCTPAWSCLVDDLSHLYGEANIFPQKQIQFKKNDYLCAI